MQQIFDRLSFRERSVPPVHEVNEAEEPTIQWDSCSFGNPGTLAPNLPTSLPLWPLGHKAQGNCLGSLPHLILGSTDLYNKASFLVLFYIDSTNINNANINSAELNSTNINSTTNISDESGKPSFELEILDPR
jgi:hypothetical protein